MPTDRERLKKIVEQTVRQCLLEDDGDYGDGSWGDYGGMGYGGGGDGSAGGGQGIAGKGTVLGTVWQPAKSTMAAFPLGLERVVVMLKNKVPAIVASAFVGMIPFVQGSDGSLAVSDVFNTFRERESKQMEHLDARYKELMGTYGDVLKNNDVWGIAFLLDPGAVIGSKLLKTAPQVAKGVINILTGGALREQGEDLKTQLQTLDKSPSVLHGRQLAADILVSRAVSVLSAKTVQQLEAMTGKKLSQVLSQLNLADPGEVGHAQKALLDLIQNSFRVQYLQGLNQLANQFPKAAGAIHGAINKIKSYNPQ